IDLMKIRIDRGSPMDVPGGMRGAEEYEETNIWSDNTYNLDAARRAALQQQLIVDAEAEDLLSAGYLQVAATGYGVVNSAGLSAYMPGTQARFSVTVRNSTGTGSGWAGVNQEDWEKIDAERLAAIALDKCKRSIDPVAVE